MRGFHCSFFALSSPAPCQAKNKTESACKRRGQDFQKADSSLAESKQPEFRFQTAESRPHRSPLCCRCSENNLPVHTSLESEFFYFPPFFFHPGHLYGSSTSGTLGNGNRICAGASSAAGPRRKGVAPRHRAVGRRLFCHLLRAPLEQLESRHLRHPSSDCTHAALLVCWFLAGAGYHLCCTYQLYEPPLLQRLAQAQCAPAVNSFMRQP
jgi:hypothetical protein